jgi:Tol biopolymer transport system component
LVRQTESRFTFQSWSSIFTGATWSHGGELIVYRGPDKLYRKSSDGSGDAEMLLSGTDWVPLDCSPDGRYVLLSKVDRATTSDLYVLDATAGGAPAAYLTAPFGESLERFSPDGRWIAYVSNETGEGQVYVRRFHPGKPATGARWQVSTRGGVGPIWRRNGKEIFYRAPESAVMSAPVQTRDDSIEVGVPAVLFTTPGSASAFDVSRDGQRFLVLELAGQGSAQTMTVVTNWLAGVKR